MMGDGADRLAVIGMGWIGAYMVPCYRSLLGEGYEKRMFAVKAGSRGIEELRHRYGFEIIAGNCLDKLKEYKPGILVLSVRPHEVAGVAEDTIKPYVKYRREQGLGGLLLLSFAPSPRPEWYTRILGDGVRTVCILPAMETVIGGLDVYSLAFNKITYDPGCPPGREQLDAVRQFLKPLGQVFECTPDESLRLLSMSITYHMLYLLCFGLEPHYGDESGQGGCARAAGILYALNRRRLGLPGLITPAAAPDGRQMDGRQMDGRQMGGQQMDGQQMDRLSRTRMRRINGSWPGWKRAGMKAPWPLPARRAGRPETKPDHMTAGKAETGMGMKPEQERPGTRTLLPPGPLSCIFFLCSWRPESSWKQSLRTTPRRGA